MTQIPESSVQKLEDRLNNNGCINFCRDKAFPLAATSNKQCVCLNSLPTTLLAISTDGDAASGPSSSCNIKCPGDAGESCFRTSCCGGPEQAYSIYATGGEWCVIQLKITPRRSRRVVKKISATLKKVVQEVVRGEGLNFLFTVRSEDIDIITFAIAFCSWAILDELKHLGLWIMIVSLRQCANILVLMIFRSPSNMGSKQAGKKNPSIASVFVIWSISWSIKHGGANNFLVFTPRPSLGSVSAKFTMFDVLTKTRFLQFGRRLFVLHFHVSAGSCQQRLTIWDNY